MYCWLFQLYWDMIYISTLLRCLVIGIWQVNTEHVTITMIEIQSISVTPEVLSAYFVVLSLPWKAFLWLLSLYFLQECLVSGAMWFIAFCAWLLSPSVIHLRFLCVLHVSILLSFLFLIVFHRHVDPSLFIHELMNIWTVSSFEW